MTQTEKLLIQSEQLKKEINGDSWLNFTTIKSIILNPRLHKKFSEFQSKGLCGMFRQGSSYIRVKDFNNFLTGKLPENGLNI